MEDPIKYPTLAGTVKDCRLEISKSNDPNERLIKIYPRFIKRKYDHVVLPEIRLCGRWLENFGFEHGATVKVQLGFNKITITRIDGKGK